MLPYSPRKYTHAHICISVRNRIVRANERERPVMRIYVCLHKNNPPGRLTVRPFLSFAMLIAIAAAVPNNAHMFGSVTNPPRKQAIAFKSFFFFVNPYNGVERGTRFNRKTCCVILVRSLLYFICLCKPIQLQQQRLFVCFLSPLALLTVNVHFYISKYHFLRMR